MTTISAREFNRDVSAAKRAAAEGPVVITDRGAEAFVLLSIEEYRRLRADSQDIVQRLSMDDDIEFDPEPLAVRWQDPEL
ncbi:type II toxin-antitoxin system Phd/YefM family antitoxin [Nocardia farcinica]|uniref:type II toxin-antitoxin system Phd/YefM family antitoxin n=1 Tax=Nocardia farcinica TaxID=37329 RepID=UPI0009CCB069|nr:type II toxin-antitoxin system Phd/YefM family antitoxin [Nocardia farcinica]SLI00315.1 prevent-host-death family protein [Mycobacteroides abscessus subsp. abscessus]MBA4855912.1 type II toxin-antitoxin system Phd/YefM family antitoxin [Nocardia farcinica]MBC9818533.1 type II toxin-antitoxin system Phd/YefM family antitoxin [Nocardia farcinica]MBF6260257.1 type II toxin-antitoxin system Phd/YefM family antitoxin [Nocardia farcinica]MBF6265844.1 type II toxin-antitoxin system Phd/YefM family